MLIDRHKVVALSDQDRCGPPNNKYHLFSFAACSILASRQPCTVWWVGLPLEGHPSARLHIYTTEGLRYPYSINLTCD